MTASNTYGRQLVGSYTNKTGGGVVLGDVVILDGSNNDAFTTTTSASTTAIVGVVQETIANNATGRVQFGGYTSLINTNASVTRGHYGVTHTVAKQAADGGAARTTGTFVFFETGGTTPAGWVFNPDLSGAALTNPMTTKGDIIQGDTGGSPTRLGAGTAGQALISGGAAAFSAWGSLALASASYTRTSANYTTTSTSMADVDGTNLALAITTGAHRCLVSLAATVQCSANTGSTFLTISIDGTDVGGADGLVRWQDLGGGGQSANGSFTFVTDALSAGSHTFQLRWKVNAGTGTLLGTSAGAELRFAAVELYA